MAEAHAAVAFSFQVTHEGVNINYDRELFGVLLRSAARYWNKRCVRFANNFRNGIYPSSVEFLVTIVSIVVACHYIFGIDCSLGLEYSILGCLFSSLILWIAKMFLMRYSLKLLLMYKGWMSRDQHHSLRLRIWFVLLRLLSLKSPLLYSYQMSLPRLPLPSLDATIDRYLESIRPLQSDQRFDEIRLLAAEFRSGIGRKLQRYLWLKSLFVSNYVSDWWEEFVYLRQRTSLCVNSNFYGIDALIDTPPTLLQTARAANLIYACLLFRKQIDRQQLKPIMVQRMVPLCSTQYERLFNTTRIPGLESDTIHHLPDSPHIVVLHSGAFYKVTIHSKGRLLTPKQLESVLERIVRGERETTNERLLSSLTAADRVTWYNVRREFFSSGINRQSLESIESAAFVVVLDSEPFEYATPEQLDRYGQLLLHGTGNDRWFDKSFNLIIGANGRCGFNGEHSWADAPILAHLWEFVLAYDFHYLGYDSDGHCRFGTEQNHVETPKRLKWSIDTELEQKLLQSFESAKLLLSDVDLRLYVHDTFGKGFIKTCHVSPDAFLQMALQLAYKRDMGQLSLTYEASMTRLFRDGRTETVRPVTLDSARFVASMEDHGVSRDDRRRLLVEACHVHQRSYQRAMCGKGFDRHLFCLYVISKYLDVNSPFLSLVLSEPWRLSTSQTPHGQMGLLDRLSPQYISAGGGFGPVADDGYGVSYIVAGDDTVFFHVSSKQSSRATNSQRFVRNIRSALNDMRLLF